MGRPPPSTKLIGLIEVSFFLMRYFRSMSQAEQLTEPDQDFLTAVSATRPELLAHCYRMLGSVEEAEDVVQETFLRAWRALDGFEQRSSLRTWLFTIATNACLTALRAVTRRPLPTGLGQPRSDPARAA